MIEMCETVVCTAKENVEEIKIKILVAFKEENSLLTKCDLNYIGFYFRSIV